LTWETLDVRDLGFSDDVRLCAVWSRKMRVAVPIRAQVQDHCGAWPGALSRWAPTAHVSPGATLAPGN
jgi:hypothetical protein